jgi:hypothetical protein
MAARIAFATQRAALGAAALNHTLLILKEASFSRQASAPPDIIRSAHAPYCGRHGQASLGLSQ